MNDMEGPPENKSFTEGDHLTMWLSCLAMNGLMTSSFFEILKESAGQPSAGVLAVGALALGSAGGFAHSYPRWHQLRDERRLAKSNREREF